MRARIALVVVVVLGLAAACGGSSTGASPRSWVKQVCTALKDWQRQIQRSANDLESSSSSFSNLQTAKDTLVGFLDNAQQSTTTLIDTIKGAGAPAAPDGKAIASALTEGVGRARSLFGQAKTGISGLDTSDPQQFAAASKQVGQSLIDGGNQLESAFSRLARRYRGNPVDKAFTDEPACAGVST